jgi:hypothetical protein
MPTTSLKRLKGLLLAMYVLRYALNIVMLTNCLSYGSHLRTSQRRDQRLQNCTPLIHPLLHPITQYPWGRYGATSDNSYGGARDTPYLALAYSRRYGNSYMMPCFRRGQNYELSGTICLI